MSGLLGSLTAAARALEAQQFGLDVTGQNIANVNTPGYTRRTALLQSVPPTDPLSAGGGVDVVGVQSARDRQLLQRLLQERPAEARYQAMADSLGVVEAAVGNPGESIDARLSAFFDSASALAADPTSSTARQELVLQGGSLAESFRDMADRLTSAQRDADQQVRSAVDDVNALTAQIAKLNAALGGTSPNGAEKINLRDQLQSALNELSQLADVHTIERDDGGVDVSFANGRALVIGATRYDVSVTSTPPSGLAAIETQGADVTSEVTGGKIGGLLEVRDTLIPDYTSRLDRIAYQVVTQVNAIHTAGFDANGNPGGSFFEPLGSATGAAALIAVDAGVTADPGLVAAAGAAVPGDNQAARQLAALRDQHVLDGGQSTFSDAWGSLVYRVGRDAQTAQQEQQSRSDIVSQVQALNDSVSGISLDEEAMTMLRFQRAYEANARFFQAVDATIDTLLQTLNR